MILPDVNVLVYAFRTDLPEHRSHKAWLDDLTANEAPFGVADHVLSGVLRVLTHPRIFDEPDGVEDAIAFCEAVRGRPNAVRVAAGARHWQIFTGLVNRVRARGNVIPDAYLAALAIESGCELATADRGFARFPGLKLHEIA